MKSHKEKLTFSPKMKMKKKRRNHSKKDLMQVLAEDAKKEDTPKIHLKVATAAPATKSLKRFTARSKKFMKKFAISNIAKRNKMLALHISKKELMITVTSL
jgi:hypothetical protein